MDVDTSGIDIECTKKNEAPDSAGMLQPGIRLKTSLSPKRQVKDMWPKYIRCVVKELIYANAAVM